MVVLPSMVFMPLFGIPIIRTSVLPTPQSCGKNRTHIPGAMALQFVPTIYLLIDATMSGS